MKRRWRKWNVQKGRKLEIIFNEKERRNSGRCHSDGKMMRKPY